MLGEGDGDREVESQDLRAIFEMDPDIERLIHCRSGVGACLAEFGSHAEVSEASSAPTAKFAMGVSELRSLWADRRFVESFRFMDLRGFRMLLDRFFEDGLRSNFSNVFAKTFSE